MRSFFPTAWRVFLALFLCLAGASAQALTAQTITFAAQGGQTYAPAGTFSLSPLATSDSGLAVVYTSTTTAVCTISGSTVTIVTAGTCTIAANQAGDATYSAAPQVTQNIVIAKASQTITFGAQGAQTYGATPFALSPLATASSGLAVSYTSTTLTVCTVSGSTVTIVTAGTCTIAADQAGDGNYNAATQVTQSIVIAPGSQTITFGAQSPKTYGITPFALSPLATASSGLAVTYTSTTLTVCTVSGSTVTVLAAGTCTIAADQAGNVNYNAAPQVIQNIVIGKASQTITFGAQPGQTYGGAPFDLNPLATASSGLAVVYTSKTLTVCSVTGSTVTILAAGSCIIAADQAGDANYSAAPQVTLSITIAKASQSITFAAQPGQLFSSTPFAMNPPATASSGLAVVYTSTTAKVCTVSGSLVTMLSVGTCTIAANQSGGVNFNAAAQVTQNIVISQGTQSITFAAQAAKIYGSKPFSLNPLATASSGLAVVYTSMTPLVCSIAGSTVTLLSVGACTIAADQPGSANYLAALQVTQDIVVSPGSQIITFGAQTGKVFGTAPFPLKPLATASSGLAVVYSSLTPTVCTLDDITVTILTAGTCKIAADQGGNANYSAATRVTQDIVISRLSQKITFNAQAGQVFGAATFEINPLATASSGLAVVYNATTSTVCSVSGTTVTILNAGTCTIAATQPGDTNYSAATLVTQNIIIAKGAQTIVFTAQASQIIGVAPFELDPVATATSGLAVSYSSGTQTVCTIVGTKVTALSVGTCTITASQAGNNNYFAATAVSQNIAITNPTPPGAPTLTGVTAGFGSANLSFTGPDTNGGSPVTGYKASCSAGGQVTRSATAGATVSTITVQGLTANVTYSCSVAAINKIGLGASSNVLPVTPSGTYVVPTSSSVMTGLWWNKNESGWGVSITQHGATIFVSWYAYDNSGAPTWYAMPSCPILGNACSGEIYAVTGGKPFAAPWDGSAKATRSVGTGVLTFFNADAGNFNFSIDGVPGVKALSRQLFATGTTAADPDFSDLWWNADESGWGASLTQQHGTIIAAIFGYDAAGRAIWYVASNCKVLNNGCSGELYHVTGGSAPTAAWDGSGLTITRVGFIEFLFADNSNGVMNFFIDGASGSKTISRMPF